MLGRLRRRQVRKKPKRLRALRSRPSGPWLHLGWRRKAPAALGESALGRASAARCRRRAPRGQTLGKRQGNIRPRKRRVISRRARTRRTWMCPYAVVSLQKSIGGSDPEKPFPQTQTPVRALGGRGERGLGHWMYQSCVNVASDDGARHVRSLTMRRPDVPWGARGDEEPRNPDARWLQPPCGRAPRKPQGAIRWGKPGDERCAIAGRKVGARAAHRLSMEGASGREPSRRVTTAGWKRSWRPSPNR